MGTDVEHPPHGGLFALFVAFGASSWLTLNASFIELPYFAEELPEGWGIAASVGLAIQCANVFPLLYLALRRRCRRPLPLASLGAGEWRSMDATESASTDDDQATWYAATVTVLLLCGTAATLGIAVAWRDTTSVFGDQRSVALLVFVFLAGGVDCTTSVVYWPFAARYRRPYTPALAVGEGLSGLLAAGVGIVQSPGGARRFSVAAYFGIVAGVMVLSWLAFVTIVGSDSARAELAGTGAASSGSNAPGARGSASELGSKQHGVAGAAAQGVAAVSITGRGKARYGLLSTDGAEDAEDAEVAVAVRGVGPGTRAAAGAGLGGGASPMLVSLARRGSSPQSALLAVSLPTMGLVPPLDGGAPGDASSSSDGGSEHPNGAARGRADSAGASLPDGARPRYGSVDTSGSGSNGGIGRASPARDGSPLGARAEWDDRVPSAADSSREPSGTTSLLVPPPQRSGHPATLARPARLAAVAASEASDCCGSLARGWRRSMSHPRLRELLLVLAWCSFMSNGVLIALRPYATLPFAHGTQVLFWSSALATIVDPLAAGVAAVPRWRYYDCRVLCALWSPLALALVVLALMSKAPPLARDSVLAEVLVVIAFALTRAAVSYTRTMAFLGARRLASGRDGPAAPHPDGEAASEAGAAPETGARTPSRRAGGGSVAAASAPDTPDGAYGTGVYGPSIALATPATPIGSASRRATATALRAAGVGAAAAEAGGGAAVKADELAADSRTAGSAVSAAAAARAGGAALQIGAGVGSVLCFVLVNGTSLLGHGS